MDIGKKIKTLRKKAGMTQEQLAAGLNISFQSVSKWETGLTLPDLTMIPGLTRLLGVTADELLGLRGEESDERRDYFDSCYSESMNRPYDEKDLGIASQAVTEFPGDPRYLYWLARAEFFDGFENGRNREDEAAFRKGLERSLYHALAVFDTVCEEKLHTNALSHVVLTLVHLGRREEAKQYAELCPSYPSVRKEDLLELCAEGEEKRSLEQTRIKEYVLELLQQLLNFWRGKDLHDTDVQAAIAAVESIAHGIVTNGDLLEFHSVLYHVFAARAVLAGCDGEQEQMLRSLRRAREHAAAFDSLFGGGERRYSTPLFCRCTVDYPSLAPQFTTHVQEFGELLKKESFDPYRGFPEFAALEV